MEKIKLDVKKLQLRKQTIASLSNDQMSKVVGGEPLTGVTVKNCCLPCTYDDTQNPNTCPVVGTTGTCWENCGDTQTVWTMCSA